MTDSSLSALFARPENKAPSSEAELVGPSSGHVRVASTGGQSIRGTPGQKPRFISLDGAKPASRNRILEQNELTLSRGAARENLVAQLKQWRSSYDPDTLARQLPVAVPSTPRGGGGGAGSGGGGVDLSSSSEMAGGGGGTGASDEDEDARLAMRGGRCACCMGFCARAKTILAIDQTLLLLMLVAGVMALVGWLAFPDSTWLGSEFYRWPTMFLASCVFFTVAKFAEWLFVWLISFSIATFVWKIYFYLSVVQGSARWILLLSFIFWARNRAYISFGNSVNTWLVAAMVLWVGHVLRTMLMKEIMYRINRKSYNSKIENLLYREHIFHMLVDPDQYHDTEPKSKPLPERKFVPDGGTIFNRLLGRIAATSQPLSITQEAILTSRAIFENVERDGKEHLEFSDFLHFFSRLVDANRAFDLFEPKEGRITKRDITRTVRRFLVDKRNLSTDLQSWAGISDVLITLSIFLFWFLVLIGAVVFYGDSISSILLPFGTLLVSLGVIFGPTLRAMLEAALFIFFVKPFNIGDRVNVDQERLFVQSIQLLSTTFRSVHNKIVVMPNALLMTKSITNITRSKEPVFELVLYLDFLTPVEKLTRLRESILAFLTTREREWKPQLNMYINDMQRPNLIEVSFWLKHMKSWSDDVIGNSKTHLYNHVRRVLKELDIVFVFSSSERPMADRDNVHPPFGTPAYLEREAKEAREAEERRVKEAELRARRPQSQSGGLLAALLPRGDSNNTLLSVPGGGGGTGPGGHSLSEPQPHSRSHAHSHGSHPHGLHALHAPPPRPLLTERSILLPDFSLLADQQQQPFPAAVAAADPPAAAGAAAAVAPAPAAAAAPGGAAPAVAAVELVSAHQAGAAPASASAVVPLGKPASNAAPIAGAVPAAAAAAGATADGAVEAPVDWH